MIGTVSPQQVTIYPSVTPAPQQLGIDLGSLMEPLITFMIVMAMMKMMTTMMGPTKPKSLGAMTLPQGYAPVVESKLARKEEGRKYVEVQSQEAETEEKRLHLTEEGKKMAKQAGKGIKFLRLDEGWQQEYATIRFWFKDSKGNKIVATDIDELKWKLSR